MTYHYTSVIFY